MGERRDGKFILRGGAYLSAVTRATLSVHMGGDALAVPAKLDPRTIRFMDSANAMSPAGFKGRAAGSRAVHIREPWRDLSGDMDEERSDASTGRIHPPLAGSRSEELPARKRGEWDSDPTATPAAHPKTKSASAAELPPAPGAAAAHTHASPFGSATVGTASGAVSGGGGDDSSDDEGGAAAISPFLRQAMASPGPRLDSGQCHEGPAAATRMNAWDEQRHLQAHSQNLAMISMSRGVLARHVQLYPGIATAALLQQGGGDAWV